MNLLQDPCEVVMVLQIVSSPVCEQIQSIWSTVTMVRTGKASHVNCI